MSEVNDWEYRCTSCGHRVTISGPELPGQCPECAKKSKSLGHGWSCHLLSPAANPTKNVKPVSVGGYQLPPDFWQPKSNAVTSNGKGDKKDIEPTDNGRQRGRPQVVVPDDLIQQLSGEGMGAKKIAIVLRDKGIDISWRTVSRRLQGSLL